MSMAELLAAEATAEPLQRGDVVEGTIVGKSGDTLILDVHSKSEGLVPAGEMRSLAPEQREALTIGDSLLVYIQQLESEDEPLLLSADRARGEQGWRSLQALYESGEIFEAAVTGYNKGGLLVNIEGVSAFVPLSQVVGAKPDRDRPGNGLAEFIDRSLRLKVIEINRRRNRVILSERAAMQEWRAAQKDRLLQELREGEIQRGTITSIRSFGVFVDLGGADGLVHLSELAWDRDIDPSEIFNVGEQVDVYIMKIDQESRKIGLSLRRAKPQEWDDVVAHYEVGQLVPAAVTKLVTFGAFARIEGPVEGLIHVSELVDRRIAHPREVVGEGDIIPVKIVRIERDRHRLGLSLRQAREEAEGIGWVFNESGGIQILPEGIGERFGRGKPEPPPEPAPAADTAATADATAGATADATADATAEATTPSETESPDPAPPDPTPPEPATAMEAALQKAGLSEGELRGDSEG